MKNMYKTSHPIQNICYSIHDMRTHTH